MYETLKGKHNDKYEYILPEITVDKNLFTSNIFGNIDLQSNYKDNNYDTNKTTKFLVNDLNWDIKNFNSHSGFKKNFKVI